MMLSYLSGNKWNQSYPVVIMPNSIRKYNFRLILAKMILLIEIWILNQIKQSTHCVN